MSSTIFSKSLDAYLNSGTLGSSSVKGAFDAFSAFDTKYTSGAGGDSALGLLYQTGKGIGTDLLTGFASKALDGGGGGQPQGYQLPQQSSLPLNFQSGVGAARGRSTQTDAYFQNADPRVINGIFKTLNSSIPTIKASVSRIAPVTPSAKQLTTKLGTAKISLTKAG